MGWRESFLRLNVRLNVRLHGIGLNGSGPFFVGGDFMAVLKPCARCGKLIPHGVAYCPDCRPQAEADKEAARERKAELLKKKYNARYNSRRDPKYQEFYRSKAWKMTSKGKLQAASYRCEARLPGCTGLAVEVHHIKPVRTPEGWEARLDWDNLEALCTACHNKRHPEKFKRAEAEGIIDLRKVER